MPKFHFLLLGGILLLTSACHTNTSSTATGSGGPKLTVVAQAGTPDPAGNGTFRSFLLLRGPNSHGQIAFRSGLKTATLGVFQQILYIADASGPAAVARLGDKAPDGNGAFSLFYPVGWLNESGQLGFMATLKDTSGGAADHEGVYIGTTGGVTQIAREGQAAPGGDGVFSRLCIPGGLDCAEQFSGPNETGQVVFAALLSGNSGGEVSDEGLYLADASGITELVRKGAPAPDGNGAFSGFFLPYGPNAAGQVVFLGALSGTAGGDADNRGIFLADSHGVVQLARAGHAAPGDGNFANFDLFGLNDAGQALLSSTLTGASNGDDPVIEGVYLAGAGGIAQIARTQDPAPDGSGPLTRLLNVAGPNVNGHAAMDFQLDPEGDLGIDNLFLGDDHGLTKILATGDPAPGGIGPYLNFAPFNVQGINDQDQMVFVSAVAGAKIRLYGLFRTDATGATDLLALDFQQAPTNPPRKYFGFKEVSGPNAAGLTAFISALQSPAANGDPVVMLAQ